ncbi:CDP-alcohol phosphatidyltransferase family protein [Campylobacter suis]|uniref:CDP-alcohol phosphatidyltransferase family protein n=1 Tax=Campylobacter suis TaxID=2790657 RepID=A0ABN7K5D6_9BACT|nr:CDP-alcohol phosphatidyltransferase family protein [Campylobacter suis]CAD7287295.1 hypothetical protein LMG8286_00918 [Campylobacter suis]
MKLILQDFKQYSVDKEKLQTLTLLDRYFYRPLAIHLLPLFYNVFRLTPNKISIVSMFIFVIGSIFVIFGHSKSIVIIGSLFFIVFMIFDCADGSLARTLFYKKQIINPLGEFFDAFAGYLVISLLWTSLGYYLTNLYDDIIWFILGAISSFMSLYSRTAYLKLSLVKSQKQLEDGTDKRVRQGALLKLYKNLDWGGFLLIIIPFSIYYDFLHYILILMMLVSFAMLLWTFMFIYKQSILFSINFKQ